MKNFLTPWIHAAAIALLVPVSVDAADITEEATAPRIPKIEKSADVCPHCGRPIRHGSPKREPLSEGNKTVWNENLLGNALAKRRSAMSERGVDFTLVFVMDVQSNVSGGTANFYTNDPTDAHVGNSRMLDWGVDADTEKLGWWEGGAFHVHGLWVDGDPLSANLWDYNGTSSIGTFDNISLYETWYEHTFAWDGVKDRKVSIRAGRLAVDREFGNSDLRENFINGGFAYPSPLFFDAYPIFPLAGLGVRVLLDPKIDAVPGLYLQAGLYEGSPFRPYHRSGFEYNLGMGVLGAFELGYKLDEEHNWKGLPGAYKVGAFEHTTGKQSYYYSSSGTEDNHVIYFMGEQMVWREQGKQGLSVFATAVTAPSNRNYVHFQGSGGVVYNGPIPGRDEDAAGFAVSYSATSDFWSFYGGRTNETVFEAFYKIKIAPWWIFEPDAQYITNPGLTAGRPDAIVIGGRTILVF